MSKSRKELPKQDKNHVDGFNYKNVWKQFKYNCTNQGFPEKQNP